MGAVDQGPAAARLLRQRAARCDGGGLARSVRTVFRDHGRPGLCVVGRRRELGGDRPRSAGGAVGGSADAVAIRGGHDPRDTTGPSQDAGARHRRGDARSHRSGHDRWRARGDRDALSGAARDGAGSRDTQAAAIHPLFRMRAGPVARSDGSRVAGGGRQWNRTIHHRRRDGRRIGGTMRFMIIVKSNGPGECEGDKMDLQFMEAMNRYNEELSKAGVLIDLRRLQPDSKGARVRFANGKPTVVDGPFAETKELVGGYWIWNVRSKQEAIDWVRRCPIMSRPNDVEIEVREI